jgi:hypothetical protein
MHKSGHKYLQFSNAIRDINKYYKLYDAKEVMVLEAVLAAHFDDSPCSVLDLILRKEIASQATIHSILKNLIHKKLIKAEVSKIDARRRNIIPTKLSIAWLDDSLAALISHAKK